MARHTLMRSSESADSSTFSPPRAMATSCSMVKEVPFRVMVMARTISYKVEGTSKQVNYRTRQSYPTRWLYRQRAAERFQQEEAMSLGKTAAASYRSLI